MSAVRRGGAPAPVLESGPAGFSAIELRTQAGWELVYLPGVGASARGDGFQAALDRLERRLRRGLAIIERTRAELTARGIR